MIERLPDVVCPMCRKIIGGMEGIPDVPVRFFCQHCGREITIARRMVPVSERRPLDKQRLVVV